MKHASLKVLVATITLGILAFGIHINTVEADDQNGSGTIVGGIIWENTTWTLENSPYEITETVQIPDGVTLTIEPSVVVTKPTSGDMFLLLGIIYARGTPDNKIVFDGGGNSKFFDSFGGTGNFSHCIIKNGYDFWYSETNRDRFELTHSELTNLKASGLGHSIHLECPLTDIHIEYNRFLNTGGISVYQACGLFNKVYLENNLFYNISSSIINHGGTPGRTEMIVKYNSFIDVNDVILSLGDLPNAVMNAAENYWGMSTETIDSKIYDRNDNVQIENYINYLPVLAEPHPDTPTLPLRVIFTFPTLYVNVIVAFDASESSGPYSSIANYTWDFGDGSTITSDTPIVTHMYTTAGICSITLTITDEFGFKNDLSISLLVLQDNTPPITEDNYDGWWYSADFEIILISTDEESGVSETYYRINDGLVKAVSIDGQPFITMEGVNNTLEYWSVDKAGNAGFPHNALTGIKLDKTPPTGFIVIDDRASYTITTSVSLTLSANDATSGIAEMQFSNDNVTYTEWQTYGISKSWTLQGGDGLRRVYVQFRDQAGLVSTYSDTITLDATPPNITFTFPRPSHEVRASTVVATWTGSDDVSGISHCEIRLDEGSWINVGTSTTHTFIELGDGSHTIDVKAADNAGNTKQETIHFAVNTSLIGGPGWTDDIIAFSALIIVILVAVVYPLFKIRKRQ
jgi:hypothetical protein